MARPVHGPAGTDRDHNAGGPRATDQALVADHDPTAHRALLQLAEGRRYDWRRTDARQQFCRAVAESGDGVALELATGTP